ncbi:hypothetical protein Taro_016429 [Colocasia esculenta]|uniref:Uncharacterized protein n=1 Tax=Colocasia esculenta TaxID=4460 RepID=A0A843UQ71_COLES|nr:hypothetical protein [Colocasia esculenta]
MVTYEIVMTGKSLRVLKKSLRWRPRRNTGEAGPPRSGEVSYHAAPVSDAPTGPCVIVEVILHVAPVALEGREIVDEMTPPTALVVGEPLGPATRPTGPRGPSRSLPDVASTPGAPPSPGRSRAQKQ